MDLLISLLQFNPKRRVTVEQCLKMEVFDRVRKPELEAQADVMVFIDIDQNSTMNYQYLNEKVAHEIE